MMTPGRRRWLRLSPIALALPLLGLALGYRPLDPASSTSAEITDLSVGVEITGRLQAVKTSLVGPPQLPGIYRYKIAMMADEGSEVSEGTPILAFDTSELQQTLETRQNEADSARKQIEKMEVDLAVRRMDDELALAEAQARLRKAKLKTATPSELVSSAELEKARLDLQLAEIEVASVTRRSEANAAAGRAELEALRADLNRADGDVRRIQTNIERMTRTAPRDGIVICVTDWRNEKKKVGDVVWVRQSVLEIPDLTQMMAEGEVEEALAGRLQAEQKVSLYLDAHPDAEFTGRVTEVSRAVQRKSWRNPLKIVRVKIALDATDPERMRPSMRFRGTVEVERLEQVLTVPLQAVFPSAGGPVALRRGLLGLAEVELKLGARNTERVQVLEGLEAGDRVSTIREGT